MANNDEDFIDDVSEMITHFSALQGMSTPNANALAAAVTKKIEDKYQGERVNIKRRRKVQERYRKIKDQFNGKNAKELMEQYGVSRSTLYRILGNHNQRKKK